MLGLATFVQVRLVTDGHTHDDSIHYASIARVVRMLETNFYEKYIFNNVRTLYVIH